MTKAVRFNYLYFHREEDLPQRSLSDKIQSLVEKIKKAISKAIEFLKHPYQTEEEWKNQKHLSSILSILEATGNGYYIKVFQESFQLSYDQMFLEIAKYGDHTIISRIEEAMQAWIKRNDHNTNPARFERNLRFYAQNYARLAFLKNHLPSSA